MDRAMQSQHLEQAERHVALGIRHIAEQEERIEWLAKLGHDTTAAKRLLDDFIVTQAMHLSHRDRILSELDRIK